MTPSKTPAEMIAAITVAVALAGPPRPALAGAANASLGRSHHERWDGHGYPDGLSGEAIPIAARIVSACDAFDAMTTTRSYRQALSPSQAVAELRKNAGTQFDPMVVTALSRVVTRPESNASDENAPNSLAAGV